jgi:hypothetical protein
MIYSPLIVRHLGAKVRVKRGENAPTTFGVLRPASVLVHPFTLEVLEEQKNGSKTHVMIDPSNIVTIDSISESEELALISNCTCAGSGLDCDSCPSHAP